MNVMGGKSLSASRNMDIQDKSIPLSILFLGTIHIRSAAIGFDPLKLYAKHDAKGQHALLPKENNNRNPFLDG